MKTIALKKSRCYFFASRLLLAFLLGLVLAFGNNLQAQANPNSFTTTTGSTTQINLVATANGAGNNIVVIFNTTGTFTTPTNGLAPGAVGATLTGSGGTIVYKGAAAALTNHTGRTPNTLYYYKAFSYNGANNYSTGLTANATTISNPPGAAAATLPLNNGFTANWTAPTGNGPAAFTYTLEYSTDNTFATGVTSVTGIASGTLASAVTGLSPMTTYYYRVKAVNAGGSSTYSATTSIRTLANPPTSPATALTATSISATQINLTWTAATFPGGVQTGYIILRRQDGTNPVATGVNDGVAPASLPLTAGTTLASNVTSGATVSFNNTGLTVNTQYNYIIIPYTWDGVNASTYNYLTTGFPNANATTTVANPTLAATTSSTTQINLSSTANAAGNNIVVVFNTTGTFTTPTNGTAPGAVGAALAGGTITYKGAAAALTNHTGRTPNTSITTKHFRMMPGITTLQE